MRASLSFTFAAALAVTACDDGPTQIFEPNTGDPAQQNGYTPGEPWVQDGSKGFDDESGGDSVGRARFCDETEAAAQIEQMVVAPIIPDQSVGTVPMRGADGKPLHADSLLGRPEDGKFCDPTEVYADAFVWGPTQEVIVLFNQETRLVDAVVAYTSYLGTLSGTYRVDGDLVPVTIQPRSRITIGDRVLDQYTSRADQASKPNAWLNNQNVTAIYAMLRQTFFLGAALPAGYDCVASKVCDIIYDSSNESTPQATTILIRDSGVQINVAPDGYVQYVLLFPVVSAKFETAGSVTFGGEAATEMAFEFTSAPVPSCRLSLEEELDFATFRERCIPDDDTQALDRVSYEVDDGRDGVDLSFNGVYLTFLRDTSVKPVYADGEAPASDDLLYAFGFTRNLEAPVEEFRPRRIAQAYKARLEQRLFESVSDDGPIPRASHPLALYTVNVPGMSDSPAPLGELVTSFGNVSWVPGVLDDVLALYYSLTPEEQMMVDPRVLEPVFLLEPFVDGVLATFSKGASDGPDTFKVFRTTDDRRWAIGIAHFLRDGVPYRLQAQYNLDFNAVTAVFVERGESRVDRIFSDLNRTYRAGGAPYYGIELSSRAGNPYGLNGAGIAVSGFDRRLETLTATLTSIRPGADPEQFSIVVPGDPIEDRNGYLKQINGERYEFVPANVVKLYGKETSMVFYVEADGLIGRIEQNRFKGELELCPGLAIRYGDDLQTKVTAWSESVRLDDYRGCAIVFNYSINGNVLDSVSSLSNRVSFTAVDGRAVSAVVWR
ncbi:hypothetical protein L6R52_25505 [Myxococcota bacterium]|nr:hypothetical protein [Myxococcota bacterium]